MMKRSNILNLYTELFTVFYSRQSSFILLVITLLFTVSCGSEKGKTKKSRRFDYSDITLKSGPNYRMVNCLQAGSQDFYHYDISTRRFTRDSVKRSIPSPYDVGVLPFFNEEITLQEVIVLSTGAEVGDVLEFIPLGILKYVEGDTSGFVILGMPVDKEMRTMEVSNFLEFITLYDEVKFFIQEWWLSTGNSKKQFSGWGDEKEAIRKLESFVEK
jgi:hypothetical protein